MPKLIDAYRQFRQRLTGKHASDSVEQVAMRFLQAFNEHGIETAQIPRLLPEIRLEDLQSPPKILAALTPAILDKVAKLFGIRSEWLEGCDDRIYDYLATGKEPQILLDHLRSLLGRQSAADSFVTPLRILAATKHLDYRDDHRYELAPILVEAIATLGDETIYRYHIYQDGFSWNHQPARIELKAIARTIYKALDKKPIPLYPISPQDMEDLLEGRRIPRPFLRYCLNTNPSFEDYVIDSAESCVAKETDELPEVLNYMAAHGLDTFDFHTIRHDDPISDTTIPIDVPDATPSSPAPAKQGKQPGRVADWAEACAYAKARWVEDPSITIEDMIRRIKRIKAFKVSVLTESAIRKHIAEFAPPNIRGKPGRKPGKST